MGSMSLRQIDGVWIIACFRFVVWPRQVAPLGQLILRPPQVFKKSCILRCY